MRDVCPLFRLTTSELVALAYFDREGRFEFLRVKNKRYLTVDEEERRVSPCLRNVRVTRVASGHSINWLQHGSIMAMITRQQVELLPMMIHGAMSMWLPEILNEELNEENKRKDREKGKKKK